MTRFFLHGHDRWLAPLGGGVPDWFVRIELARHLGVPPDWFDDRPLIWQDWALVSLQVTSAVEQGPNKTE